LLSSCFNKNQISRSDLVFLVSYPHSGTFFIAKQWKMNPASGETQKACKVRSTLVFLVKPSLSGPFFCATHRKINPAPKKRKSGFERNRIFYFRKTGSLLRDVHEIKNRRCEATRISF
jgi:hypothetical protein